MVICLQNTDHLLATAILDVFTARISLLGIVADLRVEDAGLASFDGQLCLVQLHLSILEDSWCPQQAASA